MSEYLEIYVRNDKLPKSYKEDQRMLELSVCYGVLSVVDTNYSTYHGTLMGQLGTKNDNKTASAAIKKTAQHIDFIDMFC